LLKIKIEESVFFNYEYNFKLLILTSLVSKATHLKQFFMQFPYYIKNQED